MELVEKWEHFFQDTLQQFQIPELFIQDILCCLISKLLSYFHTQINIFSFCQIIIKFGECVTWWTNIYEGKLYVRNMQSLYCGVNGIFEPILRLKTLSFKYKIVQSLTCKCPGVVFCSILSGQNNFPEKSLISCTLPM